MNQPVSDKFLDYRNQKKQRAFSNGYIALISVLIVSAVGLAVAVSLLLLGLGASRSSFAVEQSNQAKGLAIACTERAINKLRQDLNYSGNETVSLPKGSCQILSILGSGNNNRTIQATGTVGTIIRKVKVVISQVQPQTQITSWQEVSDF